MLRVYYKNEMLRLACASMRRVLCKHVWMDVCLQSVYEASERTMQCSAVCMCLLKLAECLQRVMVMQDMQKKASRSLHGRAAPIEIPTYVSNTILTWALLHCKPMET